MALPVDDAVTEIAAMSEIVALLLAESGAPVPAWYSAHTQQEDHMSKTLTVGANTLKIKPWQTYADECAIADAATTLEAHSGDGDTPKFSVQPTPLNRAVELVTRCVIEWDVSDPDGAEVPLTAEGVHGAPATAMSAIVDALDDFYDPPKA